MISVAPYSLPALHTIASDHCTGVILQVFMANLMREVTY